MSEASFSIKYGLREASFTGTEDFLREQLPAILEFLDKSQPNTGSEKTSIPGGADTPTIINSLAINSIAAKMGAKSGSDLVLAAVFSLTRSGKEQVSRAELLAEMQKATSYYKKTFNNNLSGYITRLVKDGKLLEQASETYALSGSARLDIEAKIA